MTTNQLKLLISTTYDKYNALDRTREKTITEDLYEQMKFHNYTQLLLIDTLINLSESLIKSKEE